MISLPMHSQYTFGHGSQECCVQLQFGLCVHNYIISNQEKKTAAQLSFLNASLNMRRPSNFTPLKILPVHTRYLHTFNFLNVFLYQF